MGDALFDVAVHGEYGTEIVPAVDAVVACRWEPLRDALCALDVSGQVADGDVSFVGVAVSVDARDWSTGVVERAYVLVTGSYRRVLEDAGWDVDLLPSPQPTTVAAGFKPVEVSRASQAAVPVPPRPVPQPDAPVSVLSAGQATGFVVAAAVHPVTGEEVVTVTAPPGDDLHTILRSVPGAVWDGELLLWRFPFARVTALRLRESLHGQPISIDRVVAARLRSVADTEPTVPDVLLAADGESVEVRFPHSTVLQDDVKRHCDARWDGDAGCWRAPVSKAMDVIGFAAQHGLVIAEDVVAAGEARFEPFDYDGTIDGLRGVPVSELVAVSSVPARGKTPSLEERLASYGVESVADLLATVPFRYLDRSNPVPLQSAPIGENIGFLGRVVKVGQYDRVKRMVRLTVADMTAEVSITFFNMPWAARRFRAGDEVAVYGRLDVWAGGGRRMLQMTNPIMDPVGNDTAMIVPVYPQSEKSQVTTWDLHGAAMEAVRRLGDLADPIPDEVKAKNGLMSRQDAYRQVHNPDSMSAAGEARRRLAFDELFRMQLALGMKKAAAAEETGVEHRPTGVLTKQFLAGLRFSLTGAQNRAMNEIIDDLQQPHPMFRLLQGDVGAGKSAVAMLTLLSGVEGGYQGALMAPTEILATQLFIELRDELAKITHPDGRMLAVAFLGGKTRVKEKREILAGLADGSIDLVVGTHALLTPDVEFANLGVVVIDEQHRFGVEQRAALREKGVNGMPDMLVMTATPIPRTSAVTVFGDLSLTILDELPPGRTPIATSWLQGEPPLDAITGAPWDEVRREVEAGRQAYVVASLVEDNEKIAAASAEAALEALESGALMGLRLGLVHGKQAREEREQTMLAFKNGDLDVLIATTVIEVGVNVPNATVMVVLDATRFGIAQLHQIRGRVGRGQHASRCILTGKAGSSDAVIRMQALCESTDGFYLSEVDLDLRGMGSLFGTRQSGQSDLRVASLKDDRDLLELCRTEAMSVVAGDPRLARRPGLRNEVLFALGEDAQQWLAKS